MKFIRSRSNAFFSLIALACFFYLFLTAFTLPSPQKLTKSIEQQLEKIREKAPKIKAYRKWKETESATWQLLRKAELAGAPKYAQPDWQQALKLFSRSKDYAKKQSYKKAVFLAKKAREQGTIAMQKAREILKEKRAEARALLDPIRKDLDWLDQHIDHKNRSLLNTYARLLLQYNNLENAYRLEEFEDISRGAPALKKEIRRFKATIYNKASGANT